ncbi:MAG: PIN domain-containing protein [Gemmataceae bacterium]|nr:PIN domain-containing protein [Gemmataceae bacterium]MCI0741388.1 PIN domain-containing protein [Gemmataceae bacterium]
MQVYLDVSCVNRPFDDQSQPRIQLEAEAVGIVLQRIDDGFWTLASSEIAVLEIQAIANAERCSKVRAILKDPDVFVKLTVDVVDRGRELEKLGFRAADALHIASAEATESDVLLTCDDRLLKRARRFRAQLQVIVANPCDWLKEQDDAADN